MTTKLIAAFAILFVGVAGIVTWQQRQNAAARSAREAALVAELKAKNEALAANEEQIANLQRQNDERSNGQVHLRDRVAKSEKSVRPTTPSVTSSPLGTAGVESAAELFRRALTDPKTRDVRYQRIWNSTKQVYGDFARLQRLTPEQTDEFLKLVFGREAEEMEDGTNFFTGDKNGPGPSGKDPAGIAAGKKEVDQALHDLLGESGYVALQEYEKGASDRERLYEIRTELAFDSRPITEDQANFLLQALQEERAKTPLVAFDPGGIGSVRDKFRIGVEGDNAARYFEVEGDLDQRFLQRAQGILTPEQYNSLVGLTQQSTDFLKSEVEIARKMFQQANTAATPRP